jgi:ribosomal protein S27E
MDTVDIIEKNSSIQSRFQEQKEALAMYISERDTLQEQLQRCRQDASVSFIDQLTSHIQALTERIDAILANRDEHFYMLDTAQCLDEYDQLLQTPVKVTFMNNSTETQSDETKSTLIQQFLSSCQEFNDQYYEEIVISDNECVDCPECGQKEFANSHDANVSICIECGYQVALPENGSSYGDAERINLSVKYSYDKKTHFVNCINQYQGKQSCILEDSMLEAIEKEIDKYNLKTDGKTRREQYANVQKTHILCSSKNCGSRNNTKI